jgi:hypothetical protein
MYGHHLHEIEHIFMHSCVKSILHDVQIVCTLCWLEWNLIMHIQLCRYVQMCTFSCWLERGSLPPLATRLVTQEIREWLFLPSHEIPKFWNRKKKKRCRFMREVHFQVLERQWRLLRLGKSKAPSKWTCWSPYYNLLNSVTLFQFPSFGTTMTPVAMLVGKSKAQSKWSSSSPYYNLLNPVIVVCRILWDAKIV